MQRQTQATIIHRRPGMHFPLFFPSFLLRRKLLLLLKLILLVLSDRGDIRPPGSQRDWKLIIINIRRGYLLCCFSHQGKSTAFHEESRRHILFLHRTLSPELTGSVVRSLTFGVISATMGCVRPAAELLHPSCQRPRNIWFLIIRQWSIFTILTGALF